MLSSYRETMMTIYTGLTEYRLNRNDLWLNDNFFAFSQPADLSQAQKRPDIPAFLQSLQVESMTSL